MTITKEQAVEFFGNCTKLALAIGVSPSTLTRRDTLKQSEQDAVIGAALRLKGQARTQAMWPERFAC